MLPIDPVFGEAQEVSCSSCEVTNETELVEEIAIPQALLGFRRSDFETSKVASSIDAEASVQTPLLPKRDADEDLF